MPDIIISNSNHTTSHLRAAGYKKEIKTVSLGVDIKVFITKLCDKQKRYYFCGRL